MSTPPPVLVFAVIFPLVMLLAAILSQLGANGRLQRNGLIGIRLPSTMASDEAWQAGHTAATRPLWIGFVAGAILAFIAIMLAGSAISTIMSTAGIAVFVLALLWAVLSANRAAD